MTQIDSRDARIEYLTAELNRLRIENDHLRLTYDPDGWRAEIERLKEQVRQLIENGCFTRDEDDNICQIALKNMELRNENDRLKSTGGRAVLEEFVGKIRKAGE